MKRLQPLSMTVTSAAEVKLRCRPKLDQLDEKDRALTLLIMKECAINNPTKEQDLESEFTFTFNENQSVLQDSRFFQLTTDDYGELWINRAVDQLSYANEQGMLSPESPAEKLKPYKIIVDEINTQTTRRYTVEFTADNKSGTKEQTFTVEGAYDDRRTIAGQSGKYTCSWELKKWTFDSPRPPTDLEQLLLAIIRLDEAIHLELMAYANK